MEKLFKVFDLAFFLPGFVVLTMWLPWAKIEQSIVASNELGSVLKLLAAAPAAFGIGLVIHSIGRLLLAITRSVTAWLHRSLGASSKGQSKPKQPANEDKGKGKLNSSSRQPWWYALDDVGKRELMQYFWYLRSTCLNLAVALLVALLALRHADSALYRIFDDLTSSTASTEPIPRAFLVGLWLLSAVMLAWLAGEYQGAYGRVSAHLRSRPRSSAARGNAQCVEGAY